MRNIIKAYAILSFITFSILLVGGIVVFFLKEDAVESDVSVLLNGEVEYGFDATAYIIGQSFNGESGICGGAQIAPGIIITAAHCVDDAKSVLVGKEKIDLKNGENANINDVLIKAGWEGLDGTWEVGKIINDLAILSFDPSDLSDNTIADIGAIDLGCNYTIVGFGTKYGEDSISVRNTRQKDSLDVCVVSFNQDLALLKVDTDEGFCFGDSGSPIYNRNTGELVANLSSTIGATEAELCDLNNRALAVRSDSNKPFIESTSSQINFNFDDEDLIVSDSSGSPFDREIVDLTADFNLDDREFNIFNEDTFEANAFEQRNLESPKNNTSDKRVVESSSSNSSDNEFSLAAFDEIPDEAFYGFFAVIGMNLFFSALLLLWTFRKPATQQYAAPVPYQSA